MLYNIKEEKSMTHIIEKHLKDIGVTINGNNAWDIQVHDNRFLDRILHEQSVGGGESYMEGWWDCEKLDELFFRLMRSKLQNKFYVNYL
jgi:cyclopropane-fatty-acyl-phospholipid synthase